MNRKTVLLAALKAAANELLTHDPKNVSLEVKASEGDFVTAADLACEKIIIETIHRSFPEDIIISEETISGHKSLNEKGLASLNAWVIDPVDGTNNYKRGMSFSGISIGYVEKGQIIIGGILDPYREEIYFAEKAKGSTCNDSPIHVSNVSTFNLNTRVCTSVKQEGGTLENLSRYKNLGDVWVDVLGSSVLIMSYVASGKLDLYHHIGLKPWDNAAAFLILEEAGAKIVGLKGQTINWLSAEVVVGNPTIVDEFIRLTAD